MNNTAKQLAKTSALATAVMAAGIAGQATAGEAASYRAGMVDIIPQVEVESRHSDNIYTTDRNQIASYILEVAPEVEAFIQDRKNVYSVQAGVRSGTYEANSDDNYLDYNLGGNAHLELNYRNKIDVYGSHSRLHEDRGSGISEGAVIGGAFDEPVEYDLNKYGAQYQYGGDDARMRIVLDGGVTETKYKNFRSVTQYRDYDKAGGVLTAYYALAPKTSMLAEVEYRDVGYDRTQPGQLSLDSTEEAARVGFTWEATGKTTGIVKVGHLRKEFDESGREDFSGSNWLAQVNWQPREYSTFEIYTSRTPRETNNNGNFIDTQDVGVNWIHDWTAKMSTTVKARAATEDYEGTAREDDVMSYGFRFDYEFRRWMQVGLGYDYDERDSNSQFDYDRNIFTADLRLSL